MALQLSTEPMLKRFHLQNRLFTSSILHYNPDSHDLGLWFW
jgi:hypothetical protein